MLGLPVTRELGYSTLCGSVVHVEDNKCARDIKFEGDGGLSPYMSGHCWSMTMIENRCDRELRIFLLIGRRYGLGVPKEKASPVSVSDYDMTINKNTRVETDTIVRSFFKMGDKNDIVADGKFALQRCR